MSFASDIEKFAKKTNKSVEDVFRGTAIDLFRKIIKRTPVDEGRLKGNWQAQLNNVPRGTLDTTDKSGGNTIKNAENISNKAKLGDSIYLVNNLEYAQAIEGGHSQHQAPHGMVKVTVNEYQDIVKRQARKNK